MLILAVQCRRKAQARDDGPTFGHRWTACDFCGEAVLVADKPEYTPRCRLTPGCHGKPASLNNK